jgi:hypothetical protein
MFVARKRLGKHSVTAENMYILEKCIIENISRVQAGYNTSTVALRVVRSDGKGTQCPRVYVGHPVPGGYKYGDLTLQVWGVPRIGTIKYGPE